MGRRVLLVLGLLAAALLVADAGAFSSVGGDRAVTVQTASDENGYMSLDTPTTERVATSGEPVTLVNITNQFPEQVTFDITDITTDKRALTVSPTSQSVELASGVSQTVTVQLDCDSEVTATIEFHVDAEGDSVAAETTAPRAVGARCTP